MHTLHRSFGRALTITLLSTGLLLLITTAISSRTAHTHAAYSEVVASQVRDFYIPPMTIGGVAYTVSADGAVEKGDGGRPAARTQARALGLAHYALVHRLDPVFALEGTDPQQLAQAARALEDQVRSIAADYPFSEARLIVQSLYPTELLQELAELEEVRQHLLASPSEKTAVTYHERLVAAFDAYERAVQQHQSALDKLEEDNSVYKYFTLDGGTTFPHLKQVVSQIGAQIAANRAREAARWQCYHGDAVACERPRDAFQKLTDIPPAASFEPTHTEPKIPGKEQVIAATRINPQDGAVAPYVVEQRNACVPDPEAETIVLIPAWIETADGAAFTPLYGDDIHIFDFSTINHGDLYTAARAAGVTQKFQGIFNFYMCRYALESSANARTNLAIRAMSDELPEAFYQAYPHLGALRETVTEEASFQAPHIDSYSHTLGEILARTGERSFASRFGASTLLRVERILHMARQRSAASDELVRKVVYENSYVKARNADGAQSIPSDGLFASRGAPLFFFFSHNKSFAAYTPTPTQGAVPSFSELFHWLVSYQHSSLRERFTPSEMVAEALRGRTVYQTSLDELGQTTLLSASSPLLKSAKKFLSNLY